MAHNLGRRERSNQGQYKGSLIHAFSHLCPRPRAQRSTALALLSAALMSCVACDQGAEIPPLQVDLGGPRVVSSITQEGPTLKEPSPATEPHSAQQPITVRALTVSESVKRQLPVKVNTRFPHDINQLWAWLELSNSGPTEQLVLRWERGGTAHGEYIFSAGTSERLRTWTKQAIDPEEAGEWSLSLLRLKDMQLLQRVHFEVYSQEGGSAEVPYVPLNSTPATRRLSSIKVQAHSAQVKPLPIEPKGEQGERVKGASSLIAQVREPELSPSEEGSMSASSEVTRLVVSTSIKHRRPIGVSERFSADTERLWGYIEVKHSGPSSLLLMEWWRGSSLKSRLKVRVGESRRWRTWSWQRLRPARDSGAWTLKVLSEDKELLSETSFYVEPGDPDEP